MFFRCNEVVMGVFCIDFEHAKDMFQICKWLQGSMIKTCFLHRKMHASHHISGVNGRTLGLGFKGGVQSKVEYG